jgi:hypothetical protein
MNLEQGAVSRDKDDRSIYISTFLVPWERQRAKALNFFVSKKYNIREHEEGKTLNLFPLYQCYVGITGRRGIYIRLFYWLTEYTVCHVIRFELR